MSRLTRLKARLLAIAAALGGLVLMVLWFPLAILIAPFILLVDWWRGEKDEADDM